VKLPLGYRYGSVYAGIRKERRDDLALIVSDSTASAAAMFTTNRVQAAPVHVARTNLRASRGKARAILVNAGNANCATRRGVRVAESCCRAVARGLGVPPGHVLPASTGVIGVELDAKLILNALPGLIGNLSEKRFHDVSRAIMTTDRIPKVAFGEVPLNHGVVRIAGMTKGAGMIHPRMATTLCFLMTDLGVTPSDLRIALEHAADRSFHRLSVDGDTSTNDTVIVLANGASGIKANAKERMVFQEVLSWVMQDLAEMIARDGEGANKKITIHVVGARDDDAAVGIARAIANSPLVKTAIAGNDPNWGRIVCAAGRSGVPIQAAACSLRVCGHELFRAGQPVEFDAREVSAALARRQVEIVFRAGRGPGRARFYTCDLTHGYITINAEYHT